ncbi:hypothetical protein JCM30237_10220 [Halolamina litorea]|uniref:Type IV pilin n=1 Tax=Halolamina litorea TaxID=1515593 RepID=A0ABD6BXB8_9EURY|nr:type IV pilin [Halolamina litorea]
MLPAPTDTDRAVSPALGVVLLVGVTVAAAAVLGTAVLGQATALTEPPPTASFEIEAQGDRVSISHAGGDAVDVRALRIEVAVDGEPLTHQPPVPFFASPGFHGGPTGPFNPETDPGWVVGETASFRVAGTNDPTLAPGARLTVDLFDGNQLFASLSARVT